MRSSGVRYVVACAGLVALAGMLALATGALGGKKLKTESETVPVPDGEVASATPACKQGTKAVSGGFESEADFGIGPLITVATSSRSGPRGWESTGANDGDDGQLTSHAYCRDEKVETTSVSITVPANPPGGEATARCPQGTKVISGGFEGEAVEPDGAKIFAQTSYKVGRREWEVYGFNRGSEPGTLTVSANCREGKNLKTRQASELASDPGDEHVDVVAKCKRRQRVVSGGFDGPLGFGDGVIIEGSQRSGKRRWLVSAFVTDDKPATVTAFAYCEKKKKN